MLMHSNSSPELHSIELFPPMLAVISGGPHPSPKDMKERDRE